MRRKKYVYPDQSTPSQRRWLDRAIRCWYLGTGTILYESNLLLPLHRRGSGRYGTYGSPGWDELKRKVRAEEAKERRRAKIDAERNLGVYI